MIVSMIVILLFKIVLYKCNDPTFLNENRFNGKIVRIYIKNF